MNQTETCGLSQWEKPDRILMEDFNADNAKIDAALAAQAEQLTPIAEQIGKLGNCQVYATSYIGNGSGGKSMTFPAKPVVVMISNSIGTYRTIFWQGMAYAPYMFESYYPMTLAWNGNTVSWNYDGNAEKCFNTSGTDYYVVALLDMA